jgi:hypothetical protein
MNLYQSFCKNYLSSDCFNSGLVNGNQKLEHPIYHKILWNVVYMEDCMDGMIIQDETTDNEIVSERVVDKNITNFSTFDNSVQENNNVISENSAIKVFPNPSSSIVTIVFPENCDQEMEIINLLGESIYRGLIPTNNTLTLNLSKGVYVVKSFKNKILTQKIWID